ncbi:hypothetical protein Rs2_21460 [Raphanus sativus]|nr:hypothetical protein Rs2_21460 [Raphanus sativus]
MFGCCKYNIKFAESCERLEEETRRLSTICEVKFALSLFPSLPHFLCFESDGVLTEANPRQSFSSSVAETEKTEEEDDGGEDIVAISSHRLWFSVYSSRMEEKTYPADACCWVLLLLAILIAFLAALFVLSHTLLPWFLKLTTSISSQCSYKLSLSLELGSTAAGVMISTTDFAQHTLKS